MGWASEPALPAARGSERSAFVAGAQRGAPVRTRGLSPSRWSPPVVLPLPRRAAKSGWADCRVLARDTSLHRRPPRVLGAAPRPVGLERVGKPAQASGWCRRDGACGFLAHCANGASAAAGPPPCHMHGGGEAAESF
jgi:hypothetical protein